MLGQQSKIKKLPLKVAYYWHFFFPKNTPELKIHIIKIPLSTTLWALVRKLEQKMGKKKYVKEFVFAVNKKVGHIRVTLFLKF